MRCFRFILVKKTYFFIIHVCKKYYVVFDGTLFIKNIEVSVRIYVPVRYSIPKIMSL